MTPWREGNKKYVDQTGDSLRFVWRLQSCLPMNFTAIKSKLYNSSLLHGLSSNPRDDTYICFIGRNLDSQTSMLEDHALQWIYNSLIATVFHEFSRFTLCLPVNSRITRDPFSQSTLFTGQFTDHARSLPALIQDSLESWILRCGSRIPGTGFQILCQWKFDSVIQSLLGFWIPWGGFRSPKPGI